MPTERRLLSVVIPAYNEEKNIEQTCKDVAAAIPSEYDYEIIVVNDGSRDDTAEVVRRISGDNERVKLVYFARNFGKEIATTAGINQSKGAATIIIDADGQHPPELIPDFVRRWEDGSQVVVGVRTSNTKEGFIKHYGSKFFYYLFNKYMGVKIVPASTDFRLIDQEVREAFSELKEANRITRGLIDWLGFDVSYLEFNARERLYGEAAYSTRKLIKLALNSFVSLSFFPLYLTGYVGLLITALSFVGGVFVFVENYLIGDPLGLDVTGSGILGILILFMVGLVLTGQGLTALYISRIYEEAKARPLYVINKARSIL